MRGRPDKGKRGDKGVVNVGVVFAVLLLSCCSLTVGDVTIPVSTSDVNTTAARTLGDRVQSLESRLRALDNGHGHCPCSGLLCPSATAPKDWRRVLQRMSLKLDAVSQGQDEQTTDLQTLQTSTTKIRSRVTKQHSALDTLTHTLTKQQGQLDLLIQGQQENKKENREQLDELKKENREQLEKLKKNAEEMKTLLEKERNTEVNVSQLLQGQGQLKLEMKELKVKLDKVITAVSRASNCREVKSTKEKGVHEIWVTRWSARHVYCDGDWTVMQKRQNGQVGFYRGWTDYKSGFGDVNGEYWLGLEAIHQMTSSGSWQLRVDLEDWSGNTAYALYAGFRVGPEEDNYRLTLQTFVRGTAGDSLSLHKGMQFTTKDRDHDTWNRHCAIFYHGAWWYKNCYDTNLNGEYKPSSSSPYHRGMTWRHWKGDKYSMKSTVMKLRPI